MSDLLEIRLKFLEESKESHFNFAKCSSSVHFYMPDILIFMVLKRSLSLVFGFTQLIRAKNFICAVPLVRLQIDNLLRFRAAFMVENIDEFVLSVLQGTEVRKLRDSDGKKMTDAYLQSKLSAEYNWLKNIYKKTSGYIHLSEAHFLNTVRVKEGIEKTSDEIHIEFYIGSDDKMISNEVYLEATENMILATYEVLQSVQGWTSSKLK